MKTGHKKMTARLTPVEFTGLVQNKYQLAKRIAQQRARLMASYPAKPAANESNEWRLSGNNVYPRSHTMQYITRQHSALPVMVRVALAVVVFTVLARKVGYKKLWRWAGIAVPMVWPWLKRKSVKGPKLNLHD